MYESAAQIGAASNTNRLPISQGTEELPKEDMFPDDTGTNLTMGKRNNKEGTSNR
jgi:hypothetical protein